MGKDERQDSALDNLVKLVSTSAQITVLHRVKDFLINPTHDSMEEAKVWAEKEIRRLENIRDGLQQ